MILFQELQLRSIGRVKHVLPKQDKDELERIAEFASNITIEFIQKKVLSVMPLTFAIFSFKQNLRRKRVNMYKVQTLGISSFKIFQSRTSRSRVHARCPCQNWVSSCSGCV